MINYSEVSIKDIREFLILSKYDPEEVENNKKVDLVEFIKKSGLEEEFENYLGEDNDLTLENVELEEEGETKLKNIKVAPTQLENKVPIRGMPGWNEYVLNHLTEDEKVNYRTNDGKQIDTVKADGLRRIGQFLLGKVLFAGPVSHHLDYSGYAGKPAAWVQYRIVIQNKNDEIREILSLGEVNWSNTENTFLGFALATAETRAKGRAWKEMLCVKTYTIEEFAGTKDTAAIIEESNADWKESNITDYQKKSIRSLCSKLGFDVDKFINCTTKGEKLTYNENEKRYSSIDDVKITNEKAKRMIELLNKVQQGLKDSDGSLTLKKE